MKTTPLQSHLLKEALINEISVLILRLMNFSDYYISLEFKNNSMYLYVSNQSGLLCSKYIVLNNSEAEDNLSECLKELKMMWQEVYLSYVNLVSFYNLINEESA